MIKEEEFNQILELAKAIESVRNIEDLGNLLIDRVSSIFGAKRVSLMLLNKENSELFIWAASGKREELKQVKVRYGQMFAGKVAEDGRPLLVMNVESEFPEISKARLGRYQSKSFIIAPIKMQEITFGVINITERKNTDIFNDDDLKLVMLINSLVALQIEKIKLQEQLESLSIVDSTTSLFNHRYFQEHLSEETERAQRYRRHLSLIIVDIDNFQKYNENYGYAMGDKVLLQMANIIKGNLRKVDIICRYSGEEFTIILPDTPLKQAAMVAEKLRSRIEGAIFVERRDSPLAMARLTVSAGVAEYNIKNNKDEFIQQVELALDEAKQKGKNRVYVYK